MDLNGDGPAEVIFTSWGEKAGATIGQVHVLDAMGNLLHTVDLPMSWSAGSWNGGLAAPLLSFAAIRRPRSGAERGGPALAVHFLLQGIEALRPRKFHPRLPDPTPASADRYPVGVRYFEDVVKRDADGHWRAWNEVRLGQLNAELAVQGHSLSLKNKAKYDAVRRLYAGLRLMTVLAAAMLMVMVFFALR